VSSVADLALWHANFTAPRVGGTELANALITLVPFSNGQPNTYACGLRIGNYRGVRTVGHDGLWPGYKSSLVRIPEHDVAVICLSNDATSNPHELALQLVDGLLDDKPGVRAIPPMPPVERLAGQYLNRTTGATVDVTVDPSGRPSACTNGVVFATVPTDDGRLTTNRGSADFTMRLTSDDTLAVERDAGVHEILHRITPDARLPVGLPGRYYNPDVAASWTINATDNAMSLAVAGPLLAAGPWEIEPIEGDFIRVISPTPLLRSWFDVRVLRDTAGSISGLHVDGARVKGLIFTRHSD
jgi:hypothetical protein